ncbi:hypothetical protein CW713_12180 [Methanophagales archaeon]|nr:MAG: hypothetical protein CW713_12180 [Methanophagales archaeon]
MFIYFSVAEMVVVMNIGERSKRMREMELRITADKGNQRSLKIALGDFFSALYDIPPSPANLLIEVLYILHWTCRNRCREFVILRRIEEGGYKRRDY